MKNLEIIVTDEDGRIEMTVDDVDSFILRTKADTEIHKLQEFLSFATGVCRLGGTCRLTMGEVDDAVG